MRINQKLVIGGTAPRRAIRTAQKLSNFALKHIESIKAQSETKRYLDAGCGNGFITQRIAWAFEEVFGIDTEEQRLHDFIENIGRDMKYKILNASVEKMPFPDEHFLFVTSFEVLEHVSDLGACTNELVRVLARGGVLVVSVPHVLFPVENHGIRVGRYVFEGKIPFLPYLRPLHKMWSLARVFSSTEMDRLFIERKLELLETAYASPQFERAAANPSSWESKLAFLRPVLDKFESVPLLRALSGVSMLKAFRKSP